MLVDLSVCVRDDIDAVPSNYWMTGRVVLKKCQRLIAKTRLE